MNPKTSTVPRLLSVAAVALHLGVSQKTLRRLIDSSKLRNHRVGRQIRVSEADLIAFIARSRFARSREEPGALSELGRAALYRDGLLLAFLSYHPLRLRSLSSLRVGHSVILEDDRIVLKIPAAQTKTRQPIEQELSPRLACVVRRYITRYRPVLLRARGRWHVPAGDAFWVSRDGSPCSAELSPHLFRSMAATSVSIEAPGSVDLIPTILTHRSYRTGEQYYNLAKSLDASRAFNEALESGQSAATISRAVGRPA